MTKLHAGLDKRMRWKRGEGRGDETSCEAEGRQVRRLHKSGAHKVVRFLVPAVECDLSVEERSGDVLPSSAHELQSDWIPWLGSSGWVEVPEEGVRVVVEVERLVKIAEDLLEDLVREDVEVVQLRRGKSDLEKTGRKAYMRSQPSSKDGI